MYYLSLVFDAPDGGFEFTCPDVPGFAARAGGSFEEAVAVAREVLTAHLAVLVDGGNLLAAARDPLDLRRDPQYADEFTEAVTTIMLPVLAPAGRSLRVNLSLDENVVGLIDAAARDRGLTRSAWVAEAARRFVAEEPDETMPNVSARLRATNEAIAENGVQVTGTGRYASRDIATGGFSQRGERGGAATSVGDGGKRAKGGGSRRKAG
jgi:predicted RNase H-like HicB family nuclease